MSWLPWSCVRVQGLGLQAGSPSQALYHTRWVWARPRPVPAGRSGGSTPASPALSSQVGAVSAEPSRMRALVPPVSRARPTGRRLGRGPTPQGALLPTGLARWPGLSGEPCPPCPHGPTRPARSSRCHTRWLHARCGSGPSLPRRGPTSWPRSGNEEEHEQGTERWMWGRGRGGETDSSCSAHSAGTHPVFERPSIRE